MAAAVSHRGLFMKIWVVLLVLTLIEIYLAYIHLNMALMLTLLMGLSIIKAGMIMAIFMHLWFDRRSLSWLLVPPLLACILIMVGYFFPDSFRIVALAPQ